MSALCAGRTARRGFAAVLPLPDVASSIAEARRALALPGALGVKVPTNACGTYLGDPSLDPLMAYLDTRRAVVTIHPTKPSAVPVGQFAARHAPLFEFLADTTRAVLNLVTEGVLDRYPNVRWVVPHCGAFVPEVAHRMDGISHVLVPAGLMSNVDVLLAVRSLYFDLAGDAEPVMLDALLKVADPTHLLYGSDWPYTPAPLALRKAEALFCGPHAELIEGAAWQNAASLYGFTQVSL
jgi:predicted TIM-barrel fold metal-dependent hydrolase